MWYQPPMRLLMSIACLSLLAGCNCGGGNTPVLECPTPTGSGTDHSPPGGITASETWKAADSPHIVASSLSIYEMATLTIEPCAVVQFKESGALTVRGQLLAEGTATKPITFGPQTAGAKWGSIVLFVTQKVSRLAHVTITGGGSDTVNTYGALEIRGKAFDPVQHIAHLDTVTVKDPVQFGVSARDGADFTPESKNLTITGAPKGPMRITPRLATNVPTGSYTGNGLDEILVGTENNGAIAWEDVTFHDRGVPYRIGEGPGEGDISVGDNAKTALTLTIEPGVTFRFVKSPTGGIFIESGTSNTPALAALVAVGTAAKPITFESAEANPMPGDWRGFVFALRPNDRNKLEYVRIRHAGGPSAANGFHCQADGKRSMNEDAAIWLVGPTPAFLKNSEISDSAGDGVNLGFTGDPIDFGATNTFSNIAKCRVSTPYPTMGDCTGKTCT